jgi:hypothetical protein
LAAPSTRPGFFVVFHFFGLAPGAALPELEAAGRAFCGMPWHVAQAEHGAEGHVETYCFRATYVTQLLTDGLRLTPERVQIGTGDVAWTLGKRPPPPPHSAHESRQAIWW